MDKGAEQTLPQKAIQVCEDTSQIIRDRQIKATKRCHHTPARKAVIRKTKGQERERFHTAGNRDRCGLCRKQGASSHNKKKNGRTLQSPYCVCSPKNKNQDPRDGPLFTEAEMRGGIKKTRFLHTVETGQSEKQEGNSAGGGNLDLQDTGQGEIRQSQKDKHCRPLSHEGSQVAKFTDSKRRVEGWARRKCSGLNRCLGRPPRALQCLPGSQPHLCFPSSSLPRCSLAGSR